MTRALGPVGRKFRSLGIDCEEGLQALLPLVKVKGSISRGADIVATGGSAHYSTVLLNGTACRYKVTESGRRQIFTFQYPGDFCDLNRYVLAESDDAVAAFEELRVAGVEALAPVYHPPWGGSRFFCLDPDGYVIEFETPA